MQAVIKAGGKQYIVEPNQTLEIDLVASDAKKLNFEPLLVIDGDKVTVGTPVVSGVTVNAEVVSEVKGDKIKVLKFKPKKRVKKLTGHRQHYTQIKITGIGSAKSAAAKSEKPVAKPATKTTAKAAA
jgi:large subunit ribosomal protein L21